MGGWWVMNGCQIDLCVCRDHLVSLVQPESQETKDEGWGLRWPSNCFTVSHLSRAVVTLCNYMFSMQGPAGPQGAGGQRGPNVSTAKWMHCCFFHVWSSIYKETSHNQVTMALYRQIFIFHLQMRNKYKTYPCLFSHREPGGKEEQRDPLENREKR